MEMTAALTLFRMFLSLMNSNMFASFKKAKLVYMNLISDNVGSDLLFVLAASMSQ